MLVLDDAHWLDSSSWALLRIVIERNPALLAVIATRPMHAPIPVDYTQLIGRPDGDHLVLDALPPADVEALVGARLGVTSLPAAVSGFIQERAEGNPFFSEELALALRDGGLIEVRDGICTTAPGVDDLRALDVPTTIQGVITSRIDRLPPQQQLTLKVASIIGRIFSYFILRGVHPVDTESQRLREHLEGLVRLDITRLYHPEPDLAYMFKHIITQEVVYSLMLSAQQQQLHRAVAEWYEREYAADLSPYYSLLAYHWQRAAEHPQAPPVIRFKAIDYLDLAGDQALRSSAYQEAIDFYERAMSLEPDRMGSAAASVARAGGGRMPAEVHRHAKRYLRLGEALRNWGRPSDSRKYLERAAALYGYSIPISTRQTTFSLLKQIGQQVLHRLWPGRYVARAREGEDTILLETARTYMFISEIFFFTNEVMLSLYAAVLSLNLCESAGPSGQLATTYGGMGLLLGTVGLHRGAESYHRMAVDTARATGKPIDMALALRSASLYYVELGRWAEAEENLKTCIDIAGTLGDKRDWGDLVSMLAGVYAFRGDIPRALDMLTSITGPRSGSLMHRTISALWRGGFTLRLGDFDEAIRLLKAALELTDGSTDALTMVFSKISAWAYLGAAYLRLGQYAPAREAADTAWRMISTTKPGAFHLGSTFEYVAETYLALIEAGVVQTNAERQRMLGAVKSLTRDLLRTASPTIKMRGWRCEGLLRAQQGRVKQALHLWHKNRDMAERLEMPFELGLAHLEIGLHLPEGDAERAKHLARARELFERIGARYECSRAEQAQASTRLVTAAPAS
jgi:tetratricopeptide (TPR) repeat protein